jgi:hypothetical protein
MNETLFRDLNEELRSDKGATAVERSTFVCECADLNCQLRLSLTLDEYRKVRENPMWFLVFPGHEIEEIEKVVAGVVDRYRVVEKTGPGRKVAGS